MDAAIPIVPSTRRQQKIAAVVKELGALRGAELPRGCVTLSLPLLFFHSVFLLPSNFGSM